MIKLGNLLDKAGIPYIWTVFTNDVQAIQNPNIVYLKPRLDISNFIANADYLIQLSDKGEGFGYTPAEALILGTPVITTPCPAFLELGIKDGVNGFLLDYNMNNVPIEKIYKGLPKFEYTPPKDEWNKLLAKGESTYKEEMKMKYLVEATGKYKKTNTCDAELSIIKGVDQYFPEEGEQWEVTMQRKDLLVERGFVKVVKEIKGTSTKEAEKEFEKMADGMSKAGSKVEEVQVTPKKENKKSTKKTAEKKPATKKTAKKTK